MRYLIIISLLLCGTAFGQTPFFSQELEEELRIKASQQRHTFFLSVKSSIASLRASGNSSVQNAGNLFAKKLLEDLGVISEGEDPNTVEDFRAKINEIMKILNELVDPETVEEIKIAMKAQVQPEDRLPSVTVMQRVNFLINNFSTIDTDSSGGLSIQEIEVVDEEGVMTQKDFDIIDDNGDTVLQLIELQDLIT